MSDLFQGNERNLDVMQQVVERISSSELDDAMQESKGAPQFLKLLHPRTGMTIRYPQKRRGRNADIIEHGAT